MSTLALNIITYENDSDVLKRCLETCKGNLFDERVIVDTTKESSCKIKEICATYNCKYFHFVWCDDFSAPRNFALDNTFSDYVLWLDSDDVIKYVDYQKLSELKEVLHEHSMYFLDYAYAHDVNDNVSYILPRERIFKVCKDIRWHDIIHEHCNVTPDVVRKEIMIHHYRKNIGNERNTRLLEIAYNNGDCSDRIKYYYAKDFFDSGDYEKSVHVLEDFLEKGTGYTDDHVSACFKLFNYYSTKKTDVNKALYYAYKAIGINPRYAESYFQLGLMFEYRNKLAFEFYKRCFSKKLDAGLAQLTDQYRYLPARQLAFLYANENNVIEARKYIELAQITKSDKELDDLSKRIGKVEVKTLWLLNNINSADGSQRIRRLNVHQSLKNSSILENYTQQKFDKLLNCFNNYNVFVFSCFSQEDFMLMLMLKSMGKVIVFDHCEAIWHFPYQHECMSIATLITCCSTVLAEETKKHGYENVIVIPDAIEDAKVKQDYKTEKLKAGFFGYGGNSWLVTSWLKDTIEQAGYELIVCTEWDDATVKWNVDTWQDEMLNCDVILCPQRIDVQPAKSNNKVTQAMAMGIPVIASPIKSYKEVILHGENGYLATTLDDWKVCLELLKDEKNRNYIGTEATKNLGNYTLETIASRWEKIMTGVVANTQHEKMQTKQIDITDIIIPNFNNWIYLRLCLDSILLNTNVPYRIIISDAGSNHETWQELKKLKGFTIIGEQDNRLTFSQACNDAISISKSKYFVILNSDTIVSKNWLENMLDKFETQDNLAACGVLSNCDSGWLINVPNKPTYNMQVNSTLHLHPGMKLEQVKPYLDDLYQFMNDSNEKNKNKFQPQEWVAAYCTLYSREAIDKVGMFDETFENGSEDLDLNIRLSKFGYKTGQAIDAFIWHAGGISRKTAQLENKEVYDMQDKENHAKIKNKWAKKKIAIFTGHAYEKWDEEKVMQGMAGSETWAVYLAHEFAKNGFIVYVFNNKEETDIVEEIDNVHYIDYTRMEDFLQFNLVDYFISSRTCESLKQKIHSLNNYVMIHDVYLHPDTNYDIQKDKVKKYAYLSDWHKEFLQHHHKIDDAQLFKTANGIMPYYDDVDNYEKNNQAIYSSSPDRGLYQLLQMLPEIRKEVPDFKLYIAYGFYNWETISKQRNDTKSIELIAKIKELIEEQEEGVVFLGRISKQTLAKYEKESKVWLYPTWFTETFCISAAAAGAAKCAILTTAKGGLLDTVGDSGVLLEDICLTRDEAYPEPYKTHFVSEAIKLLKDEEYRCSWASKAHVKMQQYNWESIAKNWIKEFENAN